MDILCSVYSTVYLDVLMETWQGITKPVGFSIFSFFLLVIYKFCFFVMEMGGKHI